MSANHAVGLTDSLTGSITPAAAGRWNTDPMDTRTRQPTSWRWVLPFLAAIVEVLALVGLAATSSAATTATAETRVGASSVVIEPLVGPPERIGAVQRLGNDGPRVVVVVATGVAAKAGVTRVFRVEGPGNARLGIDGAGNVSVHGDQTLFLNFGDEARAQAFLATRLAQGHEGTTTKSFGVPNSYVDPIRRRPVPGSR